MGEFLKNTAMKTLAMVVMLIQIHLELGCKSSTPQSNPSTTPIPSDVNAGVYEGLTCEAFDVSGASDDTFNGEYEISEKTVFWANNTDVYELKGKERFIFWKNTPGWVIGGRPGLTSGAYVAHGTLGDNAIWTGHGALNGDSLTVRNTSRVCSMDCNVANTNASCEQSDDLGFEDITQGHSGTSSCSGSLTIWHGPRGNVSSGLKRTILPPGYYKRTKRIFRRRIIVQAEVNGNCAWRIYSSRRFKGQVIQLDPGFKSHLDFAPGSISQSD